MWLILIFLLFITLDSKSSVDLNISLREIFDELRLLAKSQIIS